MILTAGLTYPHVAAALPIEDRHVFDLYGVTPERKEKKQSICGAYEMNAETHGIALIINNYEFTRDPALTGYQQDEEYLIETFRFLGYNVKVDRNLERDDMEKMIEDAAGEYDKEENKDYDSFICCILSHGDDGLVNDHKGKEVYIEYLYSYVKGDSCKGLIGKPKMFFFQACRGKKADTAFDEKTADLPELTVDSKVPAMADFFFGYATSPGKYAFVTAGGSCYIIELCKSLVLHSTHASLVDMMTLTSQNVGKQAIKFHGHEAKQAAVFSSSATRDVFFF